MERQIISADQFPYEELETFGLSREQIDDLPEEVMQDLLSGEFSPLLPITVNIDGQAYRTSARIALTPGEKVGVKFMPRLVKAQDQGLKGENLERYLNGEPADKYGPDGGREIVQLDPQTNQSITIDPRDAIINIAAYGEKAFLQPEEIRGLMFGQAVTTEMKDGMAVTAGLDLIKNNGIRLIVGNKQDWEAQKVDTKIWMGFNGAWVIDPAGKSEYVPEEQFALRDDIEIPGRTPGGLGR